MKAIACYDKETRIIGKNDESLFNIHEDLQHFKYITDGKIVVMGSITYNLLPIKPLPNRINIVLTNHPEMYSNSEIDNPEGTIFVTPDAFLNIAKNMKNTDDIIVIGGERTYKLLLPFCDEVYATEAVYGRKLKASEFYTRFPELPKKYWEKGPNIFLCNYNGKPVYTTTYKKKYVKKLSIPRATEVGKVNANGIRYDAHTYYTALKEFKYRYAALTENDQVLLPFEVNIPCEIIFGEDNIYKDRKKDRFAYIEPAVCRGTRLIAITDKECIVEFTDEELYECVKEALKENRAHMLMRYLADVRRLPGTDEQAAFIQDIYAFDLNVTYSKPKYIERVKQYND